MPRVRFETTIPVFERAKAFRILYQAATVFGKGVIYKLKIVEFIINKL
jgi:hypothetical protein